MASRWSSKFNVAEHKDMQASIMAMDYTRDHVLLAGKRFIAIKNLNHISDPLKKLARNSKYDVGAAEWNPTSFNSQLCSISTNQKIEIFFLRDVEFDLCYTLKFHTRLVSDLNWHKFDPNLLASASTDSYTHVWDMRDYRKPILSFSAIAAVNKIRWNKLSSYLLATAHDGDLRIWDQRKGTAPVQYLSPHMAKIYDLDWSQTHENQLASSSQDGTVKFFDVTNPKCAESVIQTASPIWRARYTPFGEGLVTVVISLSQRSENSLLLWNLSNQSIPVHTFVGHTDIVLDFEWRKNRNESADYQLITWSKDQSLRIWRIEPFLQKLCGYDLDADSIGEVEEFGPEISNIAIDFPNFESKDYIADETVNPAVEAVNENSFKNLDCFQYLERNAVFPLQGDPYKSLENEFAHFYTNLSSSNLKFEEINVSNRICVVTVSVNSHTVTLKVTFPAAYPINAAPSFQVEDNSSIDDILKTKILKVLKQTSQKRVKKNRFCLESCLAQVVTTLEHLVPFQEAEIKSPSKLTTVARREMPLFSKTSYFYETMHDVHIPYPKTCGARFCGVDRLVCFYETSAVRKVTSKTSALTPRSLSAVGVGSNKEISFVNHSMIYILQNSSQNVPDNSSSYFIKNRDTNNSPQTIQRGLSKRSQGKSLKTVTIYDCSKLFFADRNLGEKYVFDVKNVVEMCRKNADIAGMAGRTDLVQVWTLVGLIASSTSRNIDSEEDVIWTNHPFFRFQIEYLITHYAQMSDIQTAAMLCCAFSDKPDHKINFNKTITSKSAAATKIGRKIWRLKPGGSPYHTIHPADTSLEGWNYPTPKHNRSNSWSDSLDDLKAIANILEYKEVSEIDLAKNKLLDDKNAGLYDEFKRKYADILHRWNLLEIKTQVSKLISTQKDSSRIMEFLAECQQCKKPLSQPSYCFNCKKIVLRCSICRILVRGSSNFCFVCGHGGHTKHILDWFATETVCATGCGCKCVTENFNLLES